MKLSINVYSTIEDLLKAHMATHATMIDAVSQGKTEGCAHTINDIVGSVRHKMLSERTCEFKPAVGHFGSLQPFSWGLVDALGRIYGNQPGEISEFLWFPAEIFQVNSWDEIKRAATMIGGMPFVMHWKI